MDCCAASRACSFKTGRLVVGLMAIYLGLNLLIHGQETLEQNLHELRLTYKPDSLSTHAVCSGTTLTWEELNRKTIQAEGALFIFSGILILLNVKCFGSFLLTLAVFGLIGIKDYPWLRHSSMKSTLRERNDKFIDFLKNVSMLGAAFLLMADKSKGCCTKAAVANNVVEPVKQSGGNAQGSKKQGGKKQKVN